MVSGYDCDKNFSQAIEIEIEEFEDSIGKLEEVIQYNEEDFPKYATFKRSKDRIYFSSDFKDGEEIEFKSFPQRPNAYKEGLAIYMNGDKDRQLINIVELDF